jgi:hypothetical protein
MDAAMAGLIGAAIGGGVAIVNSFATSWSQRRLEKAKAEWAHENAVRTELRAHVAAVARELLAAQHSMEWLCSLTDDGNTLSRSDVARYHDEIHATFPKLLGALATVSSVSDRTYKELAGLADQVFTVDGAIAGALRGFPASPVTASAKVATQRADATQLYRQLPISVARIMKDLRE